MTTKKTAAYPAPIPLDAPGRLSLSRLKLYPRLSEETVAFSARLLLDGVEIAEVSNTGKGEDIRIDHYGFVSKTDDDIKHARAIAEAMPARSLDLGGGRVVELKSTLCSWISDEVARLDVEKRLAAGIARAAKKGLVFRMPKDDRLSFRTARLIGGMTREETAAHLLRRWPEATIIAGGAS